MGLRHELSASSDPLGSVAHRAGWSTGEAAGSKGCLEEGTGWQGSPVQGEDPRLTGAGTEQVLGEYLEGLAPGPTPVQIQTQRFPGLYTILPQVMGGKEETSQRIRFCELLCTWHRA